MSYREPEKPADTLVLRPSERLAWATVYAAAYAATLRGRLAAAAADQAIRDMRERSR